MGKTTDATPKKKGFFSTLRESMTKTSEGCGPGCGCHAVEKEKEAKDEEAGEEAEPAEQDEKK